LTYANAHHRRLESDARFLAGLASELAFTTVEAEDGRHGLDTLIRNDPGSRSTSPWSIGTCRA
jgi:hypothetical protein